MKEFIKSLIIAVVATGIVTAIALAVVSCTPYYKEIAMGLFIMGTLGFLGCLTIMEYDLSDKVVNTIISLWIYGWFQSMMIIGLVPVM